MRAIMAVRVARNGDLFNAALHANGSELPWHECNGRVNSALRFDNSAPAVTLLPDILKKTKVLLFSGDKDLICNHIGTEYLISNMTWQGARGFEAAPKVDWTVENEPAGVWREARNLTYVLLYNASHMVPYDAPLAALDMMNRFMGLDPTLQYFASKLGMDVSNGQIPPGGEKVDIDQPKGSRFLNGSAVLLFVLMAVGVGIFVMTRNRRGQKKMEGRHDGIQWFPLSNNRSAGHGREPVHMDELDELVVESGIQDSDDDEDYDGNSGRNGHRGQSRQAMGL
ncbi:Cell death protease [Haplosporangium sp. Z 767]|nr:Cell death protease [Haplosporangium sp. Z 767]